MTSEVVTWSCSSKSWSTCSTAPKADSQRSLGMSLLLTMASPMWVWHRWFETLQKMEECDWKLWSQGLDLICRTQPSPAQNAHLLFPKWPLAISTVQTACPMRETGLIETAMWNTKIRSKTAYRARRDELFTRGLVLHWLKTIHPPDSQSQF